MRVFRHHRELFIWAPAKINLFLEVLGKRPDGYHAIETLMVPIALFDVLRFAPAHAAVELTCDYPGLSVGSDNLVLRAAQLLRERTGCGLGAKIHLVKRIPLMAGLAGGSTDAAATLIALNQLWNLGQSPQALAELAGELGSDIAFFLNPGAAWCTGRGEITRPASSPKSLDLVLILPPFGCSTPSVYRQVRVPDRPTQGDTILAALANGDIEGVGRSLHNRLQPAAEIVAPKLAELIRRIETHRPAGVLMSGSGSTLFALGRDRNDARRLARMLRADPELNDCRIQPTRSLIAT